MVQALTSPLHPLVAWRSDLARLDRTHLGSYDAVPAMLDRLHGMLVAALAALALVAAAGCADERTELTFSSGPEGGLYRPLAHAMAKAIEADVPDVTVRVSDSPGSQENVQRVARGEADLALVQNDSVGTPAVRSIAPVYRDVLHFLARRDSAIEHLADIAGERVAVGQEGSGTEKVVRHLTRHYGLSYRDFEPVFLGPNAAVDELLAGQIEAMLFMVGLMSPACERAITSGDVRFVGLGRAGIDAGEVAGFRLEYPFIEPFVIPIYSYAAEGAALGEPPEPIATLSTRNVLVCHKSMSDELARAVTSAIFANRSEIARTHDAVAQLTDRFDTGSLHFPLHPGARAYYERDEPSFFVQYAEVMGFALSALIAIVAVLAALGRLVARHKKNLIDVHYVSLEKILERLERLPPPSLEELDEAAEELRAIRHEAFEQLIAERLRADDSFRIFQGLLMDCQLQVRRMREQAPGAHHEKQS